MVLTTLAAAGAWTIPVAASVDHDRTPWVSIPGRMELTGRLLVGVVPGRATEAHRILRLYPHQVAPALDIWSIEVPEGQDEHALAVELRRHGDGLFRWIRPDWRLFVQSTDAVQPNDPELPIQWHHQALRSAYAWRVTKGLPEVVLAFIDTGVDLDHPDLAPNLVGGYCSYLTVRLPQSESGVVQDAHGHGTSVAGAACAVGDNLYGGSGVGWHLSIMPVRATNPAYASGGATSMDIINGALWAADHGARVINVSFSGVAEPYVQDLGSALNDRRVLLVWPIDNWNIDYGAAFDHPDVLVVGGTDSTGGRAPGSSIGTGVDVAAPATGIFTTIRGGASWWQNGNSFAAPLVAGAAGLILSVATELTPAQVRRVLEETATDLGAPGRDPAFGHGLINLEQAVWLAPLRQFALGAAPAHEVRGQYDIEDLYTLARDSRDLTGDGVADALDGLVLRDLLRYDEATEVTFRPR